MSSFLGKYSNKDENYLENKRACIEETKKNTKCYELCKIRDWVRDKPVCGKFVIDLRPSDDNRSDGGRKKYRHFFVQGASKPRWTRKR